MKSCASFRKPQLYYFIFINLINLFKVIVINAREKCSIKVFKRSSLGLTRVETRDRVEMAKLAKLEGEFEGSEDEDLQEILKKPTEIKIYYFVLFLYFWAHLEAIRGIYFVLTGRVMWQTIVFGNCLHFTSFSCTFPVRLFVCLFKTFPSSNDSLQSQRIGHHGRRPSSVESPSLQGEASAEDPPRDSQHNCLPTSNHPLGEGPQSPSQVRRHQCGSLQRQAGILLLTLWVAGLQEAPSCRRGWKEAGLL